MRRVAGTLSVLLCIAAVFSDFLSPVSPEEQDLMRFFAPPTRVHFTREGELFSWHLFINGYTLVDPLDIVYEPQTEVRYPLHFFANGHSYRLFGAIPCSRHLLAGTGFHPLGTDELGRDVLARLLSGARTSLLIVTIGLFAYSLIGLAIGAFAGVSGGHVDSALMRMSELVLTLPVLYLILALRAILPLKVPLWQALLLTAVTIAGVTWPPMAKGVRGMILQLRNSGYVEAARSIGCSRGHILIRHMIPELTSFVLAQAAVAAPIFLLGEVVLSFLDVGFRDAGPSWGSMLRGLRNDPRLMTDFWWNLAPLFSIFLTLFCLNTLSRRSIAENDRQGL